jgi:integrase
LRIDDNSANSGGSELRQAFNFTARAIEELPPSASRNLAIYYDEKDPRLGLYITKAGHKSYFVRKRIKGKDRRIVIGSAGEMTPDHARESLRNMKQMFLAGVDPLVEKERARQAGLTLGDLFEQYMERYSKLQKKSWRYDESEIKAFLSHWFKVRLSDIKRSDIRLLHEKLFKEKGPYRANRMLERIKAMYNKAIEWDWEGVNPAMGIKMYPVKSRDRFIQADEMPYFIRAVEEEDNRTIRDYLWILLLTGARKTNTVMMRWEEINWKSCYWRIPDTKNGEPVVVPLVEKAINILEERRRASNSEWVFASDFDSTKHFVNFKRAWKRTLQKATLYLWAENERVKKIIADLKIEINHDNYIDQLFTAVQNRAKCFGIPLVPGLTDIRLHDLRRTLGSYQAINGTSLQIIGQSLGHKSLKSTQIYARLTLDPVRASVANAVEKMLDCDLKSHTF